MAEPEETTIGDRIKFIRGSLSKIEFAGTLGTTRNTFLNYETNKALPDFERLQIMHKKFKVNINWLLAGEGKPYLKRLQAPPDIETRIIEMEARISASKPFSRQNSLRVLPRLFPPLFYTISLRFPSVL